MRYLFCAIVRNAFQAGVLGLTLFFAGTGCGLTRLPSEPAATDYVLAFTDSQRRVLLVNAAGTVVDISGLFPNLFARSIHGWSPDRRQALYTAVYSNTREVMVVDVAGAVANVSNSPAQDGSPSWSPDGRSIGFLSAREACPIDTITPDKDCLYWKSQIFLTDVSGAPARQVTFGSGSKGRPEWLPDNAHIVYSLSDPGGSFLDDSVVDIYRTHLATGQTSRLTDARVPTMTAVYAYNSNPLPSPDGRHIVFNSYRDNDDELYLMKPDGSNQIRLTDITGSEIDTAWSPDGAYIAWTHWGSASEVLILEVASKTILDTHTQVLGGCNPVWLPVTGKLAFVIHCDSRNKTTRDAIYVMNMDGSQKQNLTARFSGSGFRLIGWVTKEWMTRGEPVTQ